MEFDKRTILAFILIGFILIFTSTDFYRRLVMPESVKSKSQTITETKKTEIPQIDTTVAEKIKHDTTSKKAIFKLPTKVKNEKHITVETNLYRAVFSNKGGSLLSWTLKKYVDADSNLVQMVGEDGFGNLGILLPFSEDTLDTGELLFEVNKKHIVLSKGKNQDNLEFYLDIGDGRLIKKTFTFYNNKYYFDFKVDFIKINELIEEFSYFITWKSGLRPTEPNLKDDMSRSYGYTFQGDLEKFKAKDKYKVFDNPTDWVAIRTKYFTCSIIPRTIKGEGVIFYGEQIPVGGRQFWKKYAFDLKMPFYEKDYFSNIFTVYCGPLDYDRIKSFNVNLEKIMDFGWAPIRPFSKVVLWSFKKLHRVVPNYGFVIIIFSIFIKIILFPLTRKSYKSMKAMQQLQPLIQEINEKYKDDPQRKQQEMMRLYKEYGVNPLGGCIPMLLQMPLLIALFRIFSTTIELRQAPFIWWIKDLSRPDTIAKLPFTIPLYGNNINVLPLFMGVTMFIQQKISIKDPKQKMMVYFMPIFFTLLFNNFPSGLNLYYALFNLFSILQEKLMPYNPQELTKKVTETKKAKKLYKRKRTVYDKWRRS